ncbi:MAG: hypothetical protein J5689_01585 [Clostridia bacterium]|nr:hypothetical protein [Clostridia bacterium]
MENQEQKEVRISSSLLNLLFAIVALGLIVLCKILFGFGVASAVFYGIMSILIYCLPFVGMLLSYFSNKKLTFEFWANLAVLAFAIWQF